MTTNIVKWWKTRFWNGYKQFTVLMPADSCSEGGGGARSGCVSDTEELLPASHPSPQSAPPRAPCCGCGSTCSVAGVGATEPPPHQQPPPPPVASTPRRELKFEEFECDVAVQEESEAGGPGGAEPRGAPRQEFSFTLYDLDGHGKITKDDIAGLVTTIYETLGATIQVPNSGSKTIRVRLTVAPENRDTPPSPSTAAAAAATSCHNKSSSCAKESPYQNLSPARLASNAEQLYSQLNPQHKSKHEIYSTVNHKNNESVHHHHCRSPLMGHKLGSVRVCNIDSCSSTPHKTAKLNNEEFSRLCDVDTPPSKQGVRFCSSETYATVHADSPLTSRKLTTEFSRKEAAVNSSPCSPLRAAAASGSPMGKTRPSVCVNSPRTSGRKMASHGASPARSRRRNTTAASFAPHSGGVAEGLGRERAYSGTLQRQELLNIIQTNMEKNLQALNINPTTHHRKRGEDGHHRHHSSAAAATTGASPRVQNSSRRASKVSRVLGSRKSTTRTSVDPANKVISCSHYYLDLAGLESSSLCPHCEPRGGHIRSRSHDTTTLHSMRHKTREVDHARAMAQVVQWLQGAGGPRPPTSTHGQESSAPGEEEGEEEREGEGEDTRTHRHIHEHVHHHYHHYTDTQLLV